MTKSSCGPDPSEPWEWRLACRGDGQGGESGGCTWTHTHTHTHTYNIPTGENLCQPKTSTHARANITVNWSQDKPKYSAVWGKLPWGHFPLSPGPEEQMQRRASPDWLLWPTHTHTEGWIKWQKMNLASLSCAPNMWLTCVLGLFTKAPIFLVNALRASTGSEGETLLLPSSLLPSPLCDRLSSSPLDGQTGSLHS